MRIGEIMQKGDNQKYQFIFSDEDIIDVDPLIYLCSYNMLFIAYRMRNLGNYKHNIEYYMQEAKNEAIEFVGSYGNKPLPIQLKKILFTEGKKAQENLLNNFTFTPSEFITFQIFAGSYGYKFSQYIHDRGAPEELKNRVPVLIDTSKDTVQKIGRTDLSDAALKYVVDENKKIIVQFLAKNERWVCFYRTTKGLAGREPGEIGSQSHMHFISSDYGISKDKIIEDLRKGKITSKGFHVRVSDNNFYSK